MLGRGQRFTCCTSQVSVHFVRVTHDSAVSFAPVRVPCARHEIMIHVACATHLVEFGFVALGGEVGSWEANTDLEVRAARRGVRAFVRVATRAISASSVAAFGVLVLDARLGFCVLMLHRLSQSSRRAFVELRVVAASRRWFRLGARQFDERLQHGVQDRRVMRTGEARPLRPERAASRAVRRRRHSGLT